MSRLTLLVFLLSMASTSGFASVQSDCAAIDGLGISGDGVTMCQKISNVAANLDQFKPPAPCANKDPNLSFTLGEPANPCSSPSESGGGGSSGTTYGGG